MGSSIDDKVVAMSFESSKFESGVHNTLSALDKLKAALHFGNASKGLEQINTAANRMDLSHIGRSVDEIKGKFGALSVAALAVFATIATKAVAAAANIVKGFTLDPIKAGFAEYSTNLNAIQTILANTAAAGSTLKDVNAALAELNAYSDKTIYNFSQMAKNIGTFTAAGVDLDTATASIKGIANLAALSGSNAEQASTAMYQLSQAISAGRVGLQDWNSVVNAGMGGTVFQRALAQTAERMGELKKGSVELVGPMKNVSIYGQSFRQSMQAGPGTTPWLTSKVLTATLQQFTGDLTDAQLAAQGFNDEQIRSIQQTAKLAQHAATEVKTISQVFDVAKETAGSGWAKTFQIIFGDFEEAKTTFTALSNTINGFINQNADARNKVLADWKALGGRAALIDSIKIAFQNLGKILAPIKDAFRDIFPATTGKDLFDLTVKFHQLAEALKPSPETVENLRRTFAGLFAVVDIGRQVIHGIFTMLSNLFDSVGAGKGGFLSLTASIGDFLVKLDESLKKGDGINKFFSGLGEVLAVPVKLFKELASVIANVFSGFSSGGLTGEVSATSAALEPFKKILEGIGNIAPKVLAFIKDIADALKPAFDAYLSILNGFGIAIGEAAANMNFDAILQVIKTGLFASLVLALKQFLGKGSAINQLVGVFGAKGIFSSIAGSFSALEGSMKSLQTNLQAKTLKEIAIAIALLTASVVALSFVNPEKLKSSITAIAFMMGELLASMAILEKITASGGFVRLPIIAGALILLAGAIDILALAVFGLSKLSWDELVRGLTGVGALLGGVSAAVIPLSANSAGMIRASIGIGAIAVSMLLLTASVKILSTMDLPSLAKGLGGVAVGLGVMVAAMAKMKAVPVKSTAGLILMASALVILAEAIKIMGSMSLKELGKGLTGFAVGLAGMVVAMKYMPKNMLTTAASLVVVAAAMNLVAKALLTMGKMSWEELARGLTALAASLGIMAGALYLMKFASDGALALGVVAAGMSLLAPALVKMGAMSWQEIIKGLVTLAGALGIMAGAASLMSGAIIPMLGFGAAIALIGGGLALAGAGVFLVGAGLSAIAVAGPAAVGILVAALLELEEGMIKTAKNLILGLLEIVEAFAKTAPQFVDAIVKIIDSLLQVVIKSAPKMGDAITVLIQTMLKILRDNQNDIIKAGFDLIVALLKGLKTNIPLIVPLVVDIIAKFLDGLAKNIGKIVDAGADLLVSFIKGVGRNLNKIVDSVGDIIEAYIRAISNNLGKIVDAGANLIISFIEGLGRNLNGIISAAGTVIVKFIEGIGKNIDDIVTAGADLIISFIEGISSNSLRIIQAAFQTIHTFMVGLTLAINANAPQIRQDAFNLGVAIVDGFTFGMASKAVAAYNKAKEIGGGIINAAKHAAGVKSPSKYTHEIGVNIMQGLMNGMGNHAPKVYAAAEAMSNELIAKFKQVFKIKSPSQVMIELGKLVGQGFAQGLKGSQDDIRDAFTELNEKLVDAMTDAREEIASENEKLHKLQTDIGEKQAAIRKLLNEKKQDPEAIKRAQNDLAEMQTEQKKILAVISENEDILSKSTSAHKALVKELKDEKNELIILAGDYDRLSTKLETAQKKLDDLRQQRKDIIESTTAKFATLPELDTTSSADIASARKNLADEKAKLAELQHAQEKDQEAITAAQTSVASAQANLSDLLKGKTLDSAGNSVDQLATYEDALKHQTTAIGAYNSTLQQLRKLGLDDATYKKLVDDGVADQAFAKQLLAGGQKAVDRLNFLDKRLQKVSEKLGTNTGDKLFKAGIQAAQGLVDGLEDKRDAVGDKMAQIAREMVARMKKELGIKSPSREFMEIGKFSMEGLVSGFNQSMHLVEAAANSVVDSALTAMQKSMTNLHDIVLSDLNVNPVITPILDLTTVRSQSKELAGLIPATTSYGQASQISIAPNDGSTDLDAALMAAGIKFEQNNYSPKALSQIDIYRQTKNQLSQLKSVLAIN